MRIVTLIALIFLAAPFVRVQVQDAEIRLTHWPNGQVRSQIEARRNLQGRMIRDGRAQLFHEDGSLWGRGDFTNDQEQGRWVWFDPGGEVSAVCDYIDGAGKYHDLLPNGKVLREGKMIGTAREGQWREYYPSGRVKLEGGYLNDQQHGRWTAYTDQDSPVSETVRFEHGEIVERF